MERRRWPLSLHSSAPRLSPAKAEDSVNVAVGGVTWFGLAPVGLSNPSQLSTFIGTKAKNLNAPNLKVRKGIRVSDVGFWVLKCMRGTRL